MKNTSIQLGWFISIIFIFARCSSDTNKEIVAPPAELSYSISQLTVEEGQKASSIAPLLKGTPPFTFSVSTNPTTTQIIIDNQGIISVLENITIGIYKVSVTASNSANKATFPDAFTINIKSKLLPPSTLAYNPNQLTLDFGANGSSPTPTIQGTAPFTYSITTSPATDKISIGNNGIILVANTLISGTYSVNVTAKNEAGSATFNSIFSVTVKSLNVPPSMPSNLSYSPNILTIEQGKAANSNAPMVSGTSPFTFAIASNNTANGQIVINPTTGIVSVGSNTPNGTYMLTVTASNSAGIATFIDALTITINPPALAVSFAKDIQPFLQVCGSCHNYNQYAAAKANIDNMLNRVQRTPNSSGFMPQGGTALTKIQVDLLKKWVDDGLKE
jgi:hypothetical protein